MAALCWGAGGLVRAYSKAAKSALEAAGIAVMHPFASATIECPYSLLDVIRRQYDDFGARETAAEFVEDVRLKIVMPSGQFGAFSNKVLDISKRQSKADFGKRRLFAAKRVKEKGKKEFLTYYIR